MTAAADPDPEILLRANARPVVGLVVAGAALAGCTALAACLAPRPGWMTAAVVAGAAAALLLTEAWAASRPRLVRRGGQLEVRLAPFVVERVPLDLVECVFPGSQPLGGTAGGEPPRRVATLIVRLAERAEEWRSRPDGAWGTWSGGAIVVDGRWCEPLSPAFVRDLAERLIAAKRAPVEKSP